MKNTTTNVPRTETDESRDERAEAARHRLREGEHRREAAADRGEAARDRAEGRRIDAVRNEVEAAGHDVAARSHGGAASHDEREAAALHRDTARKDASRPVASERPGAGAREGAGPAAARPDPQDHGGPLLGDEHCRRFRSRWESVQASFIDEPRQAVADADALVREATDELHGVFERDRRQLEGIWDRGDQVSTEDLRVTLQRYRSFFERLLSI